MHGHFRERMKGVQRIVNHYDPDGLIALGAPDDEYDKYSSRILSLHNSKNLTKLQLQKVFSNTLNYNEIDWNEMLDSLQKLLD
jgi:hypothetical protein